MDRTNPEYKGPFNQIWNSARLFTPADTAIQTPNSDTLYSFIGADLRSEPLVLTVPAIEKGRYFSVQLIDYYTFNFDYIGTRTTGNGGGSFLLAGPGCYLINSPMLPQLKRDPDGGLTLIVQNESPGKDKEANWLPAPKGPFSIIMRLYWPKQEATEGKWTPPPLKKVE